MIFLGKGKKKPSGVQNHGLNDPEPSEEKLDLLKATDDKEYKDDNNKKEKILSTFNFDTLFLSLEFFAFYFGYGGGRDPPTPHPLSAALGFQARVRFEGCPVPPGALPGASRFQGLPSLSFSSALTSSSALFLATSSSPFAFPNPHLLRRLLVTSPKLLQMVLHGLVKISCGLNKALLPGRPMARGGWSSAKRRATPKVIRLFTDFPEKKVCCCRCGWGDRDGTNDNGDKNS